MPSLFGLGDHLFLICRAKKHTGEAVSFYNYDIFIANLVTILSFS